MKSDFLRLDCIDYTQMANSDKMRKNFRKKNLEFKFCF